MTWIPIFHQIVRPLLASSVLITITSVSLYGVSLSFSDTVVCGQPISAEEEEMKKWSSTLSDPKHPNYNPFDLRNN